MRQEQGKAGAHRQAALWMEQRRFFLERFDLEQQAGWGLNGGAPNSSLHQRAGRGAPRKVVYCTCYRGWMEHCGESCYVRCVLLSGC
jgi:hypothetical protein